MAMNGDLYRVVLYSASAAEHMNWRATSVELHCPEHIGSASSAQLAVSELFDEDLRPAAAAFVSCSTGWREVIGCAEMKSAFLNEIVKCLG